MQKVLLQSIWNDHLRWYRYGLRNPLRNVPLHIEPTRILEQSRRRSERSQSEAPQGLSPNAVLLVRVRDLRVVLDRHRGYGVLQRLLRQPHAHDRAQERPVMNRLARSVFHEMHNMVVVDGR